MYNEAGVGRGKEKKQFIRSIKGLPSLEKLGLSDQKHTCL